MSNALMVIFPYKVKGVWMFDDDATGLKQEPFVSGAPEIIDILVADIRGATQGFALTFSGHDFVGSQMKLKWLRQEHGGNWYRHAESNLEGWLCSSMFRYFKTAPRSLFVRAEPLSERRSKSAFKSQREPSRKDAPMTICPYKRNGIWMFDDDAVGLKQEPFVSGAPEIIDLLVADIGNAEEGVILTFSGEEFPGSQMKLKWLREEHGGNWYRHPESKRECWLCPAMLNYFAKAPRTLFVQAKSHSEETCRVAPRSKRAPSKINALMTIFPYKRNGVWMFDDDAVGLKQEPFVSGAPEIVEILVAGIENAQEGFTLTFSGQAFPGSQMKLQWVREEHGGNWYRHPESKRESWLCPALFRYFKKAPANLYVQAKRSDRSSTTAGWSMRAHAARSAKKAPPTQKRPRIS